ncbi:MAG: UbiA family prenyltransferase [Candidatus Woesearchaeota archaeon]
MKHIIQRLQENNTSLLNYIITFIAIIALRTFLELFSDNTPLFLVRVLHYTSSYIVLMLGLLILFSYATRESIERTARVILPGFAILIIVPLIDLLLSKGAGINMTYLLPEYHDLFTSFITFFGEYPGMGATPGIRIEVGLVLLGSLYYLYSKTGHLLKSIGYVFLEYCWIFAWASTPFALKGLNKLFNLPTATNDIDFIKFFIILSFILTILITSMTHRNYLVAILKDLRYLSIIHYLLFFILGIVLARDGLQIYTEDNLLDFLLVPLSLVFGIIFSIITNNREDYEIDRITNSKRPHVKGDIPPHTYQAIGWLSLAASLLIAAAVSPKIVFLIAVFIGNYYLYSMPPIRFKRVPFLSKSVIGINSIILMIIGFIIVRLSMREFPAEIIPIVVLMVTSASNFIDIKDYKGDKKAGIRTIPTIFGLRKGKLIIGTLFFFSALMLNLLIKERLILIGSIILGSFVFYLINKKRYNEKMVYLTYELAALGLIIFLLIS